LKPPWLSAASSTRRGAEGLSKTSGKRGLHVYIPPGRKYTFEQAKMVGQLIARLVHGKLPDITSLDPRIENRKGRIYLDTTRNARGQAMVAPYSVRPYPGATVSTPLKWAEVKKGLDRTKFTIKTMAKRLNRLGDLCENVLGPGIDLRDWLARLERCR
jgi:bifunctional non-homologous end joining protein LigD